MNQYIYKNQKQKLKSTSFGFHKMGPQLASGVYNVSLSQATEENFLE